MPLSLLLVALALGLLGVCGAVRADDGNRFSRYLEYMLMNQCVGERPHYDLDKKVKLCACALDDAQENGWGFDRESDSDFYKNKSEFLKAYLESTKKYVDNPEWCETVK